MIIYKKGNYSEPLRTKKLMCHACMQTADFLVLDGYVKQDIGEMRMKRVLVLSDSHGNVGNMIRAVKREEPDMILHLGDCVVDADALRREFPHITMVNVPGNCDFSRGDTERLIDIDGYKVLMCHGHTDGVKMSYMHLELHAKEIGADLALFGHTHKLFYDKHNGLAMMNPGSIGAPLWGCMPSYGIITFDKEHDVMKLDVDYIEY